MGIRKFKPANILQKSTVLIIGKRNRGKSTLAADILRYFKCPKAVIFSATDMCSGFYKQFFNPNYIFSEYDTDTLRNIIDLQKQFVKNSNDFSKHGLLLVIDDTGFDKKFLNSKELFEIVLNGRHLLITVVIMLQDPVSMPLSMRGQMDYVMSLGESFPINKERLYRWFFGVFPTMKSFSDCFDKVTENFGCMILDNTVRGFKTPDDCIFHYKATPNLRYKFGSKEYRKLHQKSK